MMTNPGTTPIAPTSHMPQSRFAGLKTIVLVLNKWARSLIGTLTTKQGWEKLVKGGGALFAAWGLLVALMTYHSSHLDKVAETAERSYYQLMADLGSQSARMRIGALRRVPQVMLRQVPLTANIGYGDALRLSIGKPPQSAALYHKDVQRFLRDYFLTLKTDNISVSPEEVQALLDTLTELGANGWYVANPTQGKEQNSEHDLSWIWDPPADATRTADLTELFQSGEFDHLKIRRFVLRKANFRKAYLKSPDFQQASLNGALFNSARLVEAKLAYANLTSAQMALSRNPTRWPNSGFSSW